MVTLYLVFRLIVGYTINESPRTMAGRFIKARWQNGYASGVAILKTLVRFQPGPHIWASRLQRGAQALFVVPNMGPCRISASTLSYIDSTTQCVSMTFVGRSTLTNVRFHKWRIRSLRCA